MNLGACHVEDPYIGFGQINTAFYFFYFILLGVTSLAENAIICLLYFKVSKIKLLNVNKIITVLIKFSISIVCYILTFVFMGDFIVDAVDNDSDNNPEDPQNETGQQPGENTQQPLRTQSPNNLGSPNSNDTGYGTNSDREYIDEGADAMLYYPASNLLDDQLERYRNDLKDMQQQNSSHMDDEMKQELTNRIQELDNEAARRSNNNNNNNNSNNSNNNNNNNSNNNNNNSNNS
jgi:hypothetical protein